MNKERRNRLRDVSDIVGDAVSEIEDIKCEEEEAFDAMPEGLQSSDRGSNMQDAIDAMENLISSLESVQSDIEDFEY